MAIGRKILDSHHFMSVQDFLTTWRLPWASGSAEGMREGIASPAKGIVAPEDVALTAGCPFSHNHGSVENGSPK